MAYESLPKKKYREDNKEKIKARHKKYYEDNKEKIRRWRWIAFSSCCTNEVYAGVSDGGGVRRYGVGRRRCVIPFQKFC